jgi:hypothetical protein
MSLKEDRRFYLVQGGENGMDFAFITVGKEEK